MADIKGLAGPGPCIALRADIDALPILETAGSAADLGGYRSINEGCMHACGHDAHTAMLLSTAAVLVKHADRLRGSIRLIFQPAEEFGAGAKMMVQDGCMEVRFREPLATTHAQFVPARCL
jgi:amidohydrolase